MFLGFRVASSSASLDTILVWESKGWEHGGKKRRCEGIKNTTMVSCFPLGWLCSRGLLGRPFRLRSGQIKHRSASAGYHLPSRRTSGARLQQQPPTFGEARRSACSTGACRNTTRVLQHITQLGARRERYHLVSRVPFSNSPGDNNISPPDLDLTHHPSLLHPDQLTKARTPTS